MALRKLFVKYGIEFPTAGLNAADQQLAKVERRARGVGAALSSMKGVKIGAADWGNRLRSIGGAASLQRFERLGQQAWLGRQATLPLSAAPPNRIAAWLGRQAALPLPAAPLNRIAAWLGKQSDAAGGMFTRLRSGLISTSGALFGFGARSEGAQKHVQEMVRSVGEAAQHLTGLPIGLGLGALGFGLLARNVANFTHELVENTQAISRQAAATGMSLQGVEALRKTAYMFDVAPDATKSASKFLAQSLYQASRGGKEQREIFKSLGVEYKTASGALRPLEEVFLDVGSAIADVDDRTLALAQASKIFGRGAIELMPMLGEGSKRLREQYAAASESAFVTKELIEQTEVFERGWKRLQGTWKQVKTAFIAPILEPAGRFFDRLRNGMITIRDFARQTTGAENALKIFALGGLGALGVKAGGVIPVVRILSVLVGGLVKKLLLIALPALILDDLIGFANGADSAFGRFLTTAMGVEAATKAQADFNAVLESAKAAGKDLGPAVAEAFTTIVGATLSGITILSAWVSGNEAGAVKASEAWDRYTAHVRSNFAAMWSDFKTWAQDALENVDEAIANFVVGMLQKFASIPGMGQILPGIQALADEAKVSTAERQLKIKKRQLARHGVQVGNAEYQPETSGFDYAGQRSVEPTAPTIPLGPSWFQTQSAAVLPPSQTNVTSTIKVEDRSSLSISVGAEGVTSDTLKQIESGVTGARKRANQAAFESVAPAWSSAQ